VLTEAEPEGDEKTINENDTTAIKRDILKSKWPYRMGYNDNDQVYDYFITFTIFIQSEKSSLRSKNSLEEPPGHDSSISTVTTHYRHLSKAYKSHKVYIRFSMKMHVPRNKS